MGVDYQCVGFPKDFEAEKKDTMFALIAQLPQLETCVWQAAASLTSKLIKDTALAYIADREGIANFTYVTCTARSSWQLHASFAQPLRVPICQLTPHAF